MAACGTLFAYLMLKRRAEQVCPSWSDHHASLLFALDDGAPLNRLDPYFRKSRTYHQPLELLSPCETIEHSDQGACPQAWAVPLSEDATTWALPAQY
jgi:hypothetical protein